MLTFAQLNWISRPHRYGYCTNVHREDAAIYIPWWPPNRVGLLGKERLCRPRPDQLKRYSPIATQYSYHDVVLTLLLNLLQGGSALEDIHKLKRTGLAKTNDLRLPSPDTIGRKLKQLSTPSRIGSSGKQAYAFNWHALLNRLLIRSALQGGAIDLRKGHVRDYDDTLAKADKQDAKLNYASQQGYYVATAMIGEEVVAAEVKDGHTPVAFQPADSLAQNLSLCQEHKIQHVRADCGSFHAAPIKLLLDKKIDFTIRATVSEEDYAEAVRGSDFRALSIGCRRLEACTIPFTVLGLHDKGLRLIVYRELRNKKDMGDMLFADQLKEAEKYYKIFSIVTTDTQRTEEEVISFYNARGAAERNFSSRKQDSGWGHLPFSFLDENTVYILLMAMLRNFVRAFTR